MEARKWIGAGIGILGATGVAVSQVRRALRTPAVGIDFRPLFDAANALAHGVSVYTDKLFVYPPTAAVALVPLRLGSYHADLRAWLVLCTLATLAAGLLCVAPWRGGCWPALAPFAALALVKSDVFALTLFTGNLSIVLAPVGVGVLALFETRRWRAGSWLLVASLLVKPLLAPLLLVPILRGRWRSLAAPLTAGLVLLFVAVVTVPGGDHLASALRLIANGTTLVGRQSVYNISIAGLASRTHAPLIGWLARIAVSAIAILALILAVRRGARRGADAAIGALLLVVVLLVGPLSESHYLLVALPCLALALTLGAGGAMSLACGLAAFVLACFPTYYFGGPGDAADWQVRWLLVELAIAASAALAAISLHSQLVVPRDSPASGDSQSRWIDVVRAD